MKNKRGVIMSSFEERCKEFFTLCDIVKIGYPTVEKSKDGSDYTEPDLVRMTENSHTLHVFSHYLCDYHTIEPDVVANILSELITYKNTGILEESQRQHNLGLYAS